MMQRFIRGVSYVRIRGALGALYILTGAMIIVRTCLPLTAFSPAKISPLLLGALFLGLGVLRIRDLLLLRGNPSR